MPPWRTSLEAVGTDPVEAVVQAMDEAIGELLTEEDAKQYRLASRELVKRLDQFTDLYGRPQALRLITDAMFQAGFHQPPHIVEMLEPLGEAIEAAIQQYHFDPEPLVEFVEWLAAHADELDSDRQLLQEEADAHEFILGVMGTKEQQLRQRTKIDPVWDLDWEVTDFLSEYAAREGLRAFDKYESTHEWIEAIGKLVKERPDDTVADYLRSVTTWEELRLGPKDLDVLKQPPWVQRLDEVPLLAFLFGLRRLQLVVADATLSLVVPMSWAWDHFETALDLIPASKLRPQRAMDLLVEDVNRIEDRVARSLEITRLAVRAPLQEPLMGYLKLLSRSYVAGFFTECMIVCRSILEHAVRECFLRENKSTLLDRYSAMNERLRAARLEGWITDADEAIARAIWHRGNRLLHEDPVEPRDVIVMISQTLDLAEALAHAGYEG
jgi:hypothetical protein